MKKAFNSFNGVFVPTFLSIMGVIFYLRMGYIVGLAGVLGSILIIMLAVSVTVSTGLALSSITTTIRIGAGGAYSIISKTLGLEVGGSVGLPLYLAQTFSVVFYILGFAEAWQFIFPLHPKSYIVLGVFTLLVVLTIVSTKLAIKAQIGVFFIILLSLISIFVGGGNWVSELGTIQIGNAPTDFWSLFALFFPAVTGLMAGVGLSGNLSDPKRQIPKGLLIAIGSTTLIYLAVVFWFAASSSSQMLIDNPLLIVEKSFFPPVVLLGILAATFSSALTTFVAAPRLLQSLAIGEIIPFNKFFAKTSSEGEPTNAVVLTSVGMIVLLLVGNLDSIAPLLTMFFLITYFMINVVVFIEQSMGFVSFRPTFKISKVVPLYGGISSLIFMFLINPIAGIISIIFLFGVYVVLIKKNLKPKEGDVRSGLFYAVAEWAAKKVITLPESTKHIWKPNILLPVTSPETLLGTFPIIKAITFPNGTMTVLDMEVGGKNPEKTKMSRDEIEMSHLVKKFEKEGIFTSFSNVPVHDYAEGVNVSLYAIKGQVFHPNILFLPFAPKNLGKEDSLTILDNAKKEHIGIIFFAKDEHIGLGSEHDIHIWLSSEVIEKEFYEDRAFDLAMLIGYRLRKNWAGHLHVWMYGTKTEEDAMNRYLKKLIYESRFPSTTELHVVTGHLRTCLRKAPKGDIHVLPIYDTQDYRYLRIKGRSILFILDSTKEDVLA